MNVRPRIYCISLAWLTIFRHTAPMYVNHFHWAVRRGDEGLQRFIADGFAAIPEDELGLINEKWFGALLPQPALPYLRYAGYGVVVLVGGGARAGAVESPAAPTGGCPHRGAAPGARGGTPLARRDSEAARDLLEHEVIRRTAELEAAMAEQQALFDSASVGIVLTRERRILRGNRRLDEMFGYAPV